jgi:hypothetical protein
MKVDNKIEIAHSKKKLLKMLLFSLIFLLAGLWMIITNPQTSNAFFNNPVIKGLASYGSLVMGLLVSYFATRKLMDKSPGLVIDAQGILDNTSAFKFGLIPWADITGTYEQTVQAGMSKQQFVAITVADPEKYIQQQTNPLKRKVLSMNASSYGSPMHISTNGLQIDHARLIELLQQGYAKWGGGHA